MTPTIFNGDLDVFEIQQRVLRQTTANRADVAGQNVLNAARWFIVGAGGFGREVYSWTLGHLHSVGTGSHGHGPSIGFLDDNPHCLDGFPDLKPFWRERISDFSPRPNDRLLMAIADPVAKLEVGMSLIARGAQFASYVHPSAVVAYDFQVGAGCIVCPFAAVCCNVQIGDFVSMNVGTLIGHDSVVGDGCTLSPHSDVAGQVELGRGVFLGCQTVILPRIKVGDFARVGAGSVVIGHVRPQSTMMGIPAKRINWSKSQDLADRKAA